MFVLERDSASMVNLDLVQYISDMLWVKIIHTEFCTY